MSKHSGLLNLFIKYTLAAIIIAVPLYPKFPFLDVPGTFVSIRLEDILLMFSGMLVIFLYLKDPRSFLKNKINLAIILFISVGFLSYLSAILITETVSPMIGILHWTRRIEYLVPFFLARDAIKENRSDLKFYLNIIIIVTLYIFVYGLGQKYFHWPIIITQNEEYSKGIALRWLSGSHINSTFAGHYDLATYLVLILPLLIGFFFSIKNKYKKIVLLMTSFCSLWLLVNTASRISLVSYLVAVSLTLVILKKYKTIPVVIIISMMFIGFSSNLISRYGRIFQVLEQRFNQTNYNIQPRNAYAVEESVIPKRNVPFPTPTPLPVLEDRSTNIRINIEWPRAIRSFIKNPLLGTGYSSITLATDNDYLRSLGEVGLLGFITFSLIFINLFNKILVNKNWKRRLQKSELIFIAAMIGSLPGIFINAFFIDVFEASKFAIIFWLMMGLNIGLCED